MTDTAGAATAAMLLLTNEASVTRLPALFLPALKAVRLEPALHFGFVVDRSRGEDVGDGLPRLAEDHVSRGMRVEDAVEKGVELVVIGFGQLDCHG